LIPRRKEKPYRGDEKRETWKKRGNKGKREGGDTGVSFIRKKRKGSRKKVLTLRGNSQAGGVGHFLREKKKKNTGGRGD